MFPCRPKRMYRQSLLCLSLAVLSLRAQRQLAPADIYRLAKDAIVVIDGEHKAGTGFIISDTGLIVTNYHVVAGERVVTVRLTNGLEFETDNIAAWDVGADVAVLQLNVKGLPKLQLGDSARVSPGDRLLVISNPLGLERSISEGLVSGIREIDGASVLQMSAPISPGSSGGPVLNSAGLVIGVASASIRAGQNVNLAIPSNTVRRVIGQLHQSKLKELVPIESGSNESGGPDLEKLHRYFSAEMWPEAISSLRSATQNDEFNPYFRFALGEALFRSRSYQEAVTQLELSQRLQPGLWQATEQLGDVHYRIWEDQGSLPDRFAACTSYRSLASSTQTEEIAHSTTYDFLFKQPNDHVSAKKRSQDVLSVLSSPLGRWSTDRGRTYAVSANGHALAIGPVGDFGDDSWFLFFSPAEAEDLSVSAWGKQAVGNCLMNVSATITFGDCGNTLKVEGRFTGEAMFNAFAKIPALSYPSVQASCARVAQKVKGMELLRVKLTRAP